jgi:hypothetical protein
MLRMLTLAAGIAGAFLSGGLATAAPITVEMSTTATIATADPTFLTNFRSVTGITGNSFNVLVRFDSEVTPLSTTQFLNRIPITNVQFLLPSVSGTTQPTDFIYNTVVAGDPENLPGFPPGQANFLDFNLAINGTAFGNGIFFVDFAIATGNASFLQGVYDPNDVANWSATYSGQGKIGSGAGIAFLSLTNPGQFLFNARFANTASFRVVPNAVPEPASLALIGLGGLLIGVARRRR